MLLAHHDPNHTDDDLDELHELARARWRTAGGGPAAIGMATELAEVEVAVAPAARA